ncbi:MAG: hypothetical protein JWR90_1311 [Marmoricola sp.]|jgi:hypothetical protein|nr:hypothetical protein [Marmoricola sp.]
MKKTRRISAVGIVTIALLAVFALPAEAAATWHFGNCNNNYDARPTAYTLVTRAPTITSRNGGRQTVRYRSQLYKAPPAGGTFVHRADGIWRSGAATPTAGWQDSARTWALNGYGAGFYIVRFQVQYLTGGTWGNTTQYYLRSYYLNYRSAGTWAYQGNVTDCRVY